MNTVTFQQYLLIIRIMFCRNNFKASVILEHPDVRSDSFLLYIFSQHRSPEPLWRLLGRRASHCFKVHSSSTHCESIIIQMSLMRQDWHSKETKAKRKFIFFLIQQASTFVQMTFNSLTHKPIHRRLSCHRKTIYFWILYNIYAINLLPIWLLDHSWDTAQADLRRTHTLCESFLPTWADHFLAATGRAGSRDHLVSLCLFHSGFS